MTKGSMKKLSLADVRALKDTQQLYISPTAPEHDLSDEFWSTAKVVERERKKSVHLRLDPEVFTFFQEIGEGKGHIKMMQDVLSSYVKAKKSQKA